MDKKILISIFAIVIILLTLGVYFSYKQQKEINQLKKIITAGENSTTGDVIPLSQRELGEMEEETKKEQYNDLISELTYVSGTIKSVSGEAIVIEAYVPDYNGLANKNTTEALAIPIKNKEITVKLEDDTKFVEIEKNKLKQGDSISVSSSESIYGKDSFIAKTISYVNIEEEKTSDNKDAQ